MSIDLTKLTPAPWEVWLTGDYSGDGHLVLDGNPSGDATETDIAFIALARNAFDVLDRRHVNVFNAVAFMLGGALKTHEQRRDFSHWLLAQNFTDIFTALEEADAWLTEREKANAG